MNIINVKADIHVDGDVYVYSKKDKKYHRIGLLIPDNINGFLFKDGELISAPMNNPCYIKAKKIIEK